MKTSALVLTLFFSFSILASQSHGARILTTYQNLDQVIQEHRQNCSGIEGEKSLCSSSWNHQDLYLQKGEFSRLSKTMIEKFQDISLDQAQIWGDTILEGDYVGSGDTVLEKVFAIYQGGVLKAYHITYVEKGWYIGDCDYDENNPQTLNQCAAGVIRESAYVSADLKTVITDDEHFADFQ